MSTNFQIDVKKSNGDLHVSPRGDFDGSSAWELINLLHAQYTGKGQVFVETHGLREICPFGCSTFQSQLNQSWLPADRLLFSGERGLEIAPEGSKVTVASEKHKCQCNGNCANCPCAEKKQN